MKVEGSALGRPPCIGEEARDRIGGQTYHPQTSISWYWAKLFRCAGASFSVRIGEPPKTLQMPWATFLCCSGDGWISGLRRKIGGESANLFRPIPYQGV
jgi:hypothetical protein